MMWDRGIPKSIVEGDDFEILRSGRRIILLSLQAWNARATRAAHKYKVTDVDLCASSFGRRKTADLLLELPPLRRLHISLICARSFSTPRRG